MWKINAFVSLWPHTSARIMCKSIVNTASIFDNTVQAATSHMKDQFTGRASSITATARWHWWTNDLACEIVRVFQHTMKISKQSVGGFTPMSQQGSHSKTETNFRLFHHYKSHKITTDSSIIYGTLTRIQQQKTIDTGIKLPVPIIDAKTMLSFSTLHKNTFHTLLHPYERPIHWFTFQGPHSKISWLSQHLSPNLGHFKA